MRNGELSRWSADGGDVLRGESAKRVKAPGRRWFPDPHGRCCLPYAAHAALFLPMFRTFPATVPGNRLADLLAVLRMSPGLLLPAIWLCVRRNRCRSTYGTIACSIMTNAMEK